MEHEKRDLRRYPSAARGIMRFYLVYSGQLPSSGNSAKPADVLRIRREISPQLRHLWDTHNSLQVLKRDAARQHDKPLSQVRWHSDPRIMEMMESPIPASNRDLAQAFPDEFDDLIAPMAVGEKSYTPLVRKSLNLACELNVLFLRQQDPGNVITQGGDLDGRMKTLLDALRAPKLDEQQRNSPPEDELYCLLEDDALVSDLSIETDRLLFPETAKPHEVHLVIKVRLNVLQVGDHNVCLL